MIFKQLLLVWTLGFIALVSLLWLFGYSMASQNEQVHRHEMECLQAGGHIDKDTRYCTK